MIVDLTHEQLADIVGALGGKLQPKRLGEGFTGLQRLELRRMLEAKLANATPATKPDCGPRQ